MPELPEDFEFGRATSHLLTEARTVHSRAKTALMGLKRLYGGKPTWAIEFPQWGRDDTGTWGKLTEGVTVDHPDAEKILAALEQVVELLEPYQVTGKAKFRG